jgi:tRNA-dihydrouridine synthase A
MVFTPPPPRGVLRPLSVAPMMDRTDRFCRLFLRLISRRTLLYTEMVTTQAIEHGDVERLLGFEPAEKPLALQLGGDDPAALARCASIGERMGYDEVNLNVGCPSDRVQQGRFGACLMADPERVAEGVAAMREAVALPVTVKHRIGIDQLDRYEDMLSFVDRVAAAGCDRFSVHARKAWLSGLSPRENREIPPLRYPEVYRLKAERPHLQIEINGGILGLGEAAAHLEQVDAVMIGRAAIDDPYLFAEADQRFFGDRGEVPSRREVVLALLPYLEKWLVRGHKLQTLVRHTHGLFAGERGARVWRRAISEGAHLPAAGPATLLSALERIPAEVVGARGRGAAPGGARSGAPGLLDQPVDLPANLLA